MSLKVISLTKKYGSVHAVKNLSFEVKDGETLVLLGPSGCGKTTTLRMIAGLEMPDYGEIAMGQQNILNLSASKRDVAFMFQRPIFLPNRTILENIAYPLLCREKNWKYLIRKGTPDQYKEKVVKLADTLAISHLLDRYPGTLSGGEMQRACLARTMIKEASVMLLDEPLANVDVQLRDSLRKELLKLKQLNKENVQGSLIYVTHDQEDAMLLGDKVAVMNNGELLQVDTPIGIYDNPVNLFVAQFVGRPQINILPGIISAIDDTSLEIILFKKKFRVKRVRTGTESNIEKGIETLIGLRPHSLSLTDEGTFRGKLTGIIDLGGFQQIFLSLKDQDVQVITQDEIKKKIGEEVCLSISEDKMLAFDKQKGIRI